MPSVLRRTILLCIGVFLAVLASAQTTTVRGMVASEKKLEILDGASVSVLRKDSSVYKKTVSRADGMFKLNIDSIGDYIIKISYVGYYDYFCNYNVKRLGDDTGVLLYPLTPKTISLKEVQFRARKRDVILRKDTFVYDASAYLVPKGYTLRSLVEQFPGLEVTNSGTLVFRGHPVRYFLINGQEFMYNEPKVALDNLPAEYVDTVKIYRRDSEEAVNTGVGDAQKEWAMNVSIKKEYASKALANASAKGNFDNKYGLSAFITWLPSNLHLTVYGDQNNYSQSNNFAGESWNGFTEFGRVRKSKGGVDVSWVNGRLDGQPGQVRVNGRITYDHSKADEDQRDYTIDFYDDNFAVNDWHTGHNYRHRLNYSARGTLRWKMDTKSYITSEVEAKNTHGNDSFSSMSFKQNIFDVGNALNMAYETLWKDSVPDDVVNTKRSFGYSNSDYWSISWNGKYIRDLNRKGQHVQLDASYSITYPYSSESNQKRIINYYDNGMTYGSDEETRRHYNRLYHNWNLSTKLSYTDNFGNTGFLTVAYEANVGNRRYHSDYLLNDTLSIRHSHRQLYEAIRHGASLSYKQLLKRWTMSMKLKAIADLSKLSYHREEIDTVLNNSFVNLEPSFTLNFNPGKSQEWKFTYDMTQERPLLNDRIPYYNDLDPLHINIRNTHLKKQETHKFDLSYENFLEKSETSINSSLSFSLSHNAWRNAAVYNKSTGAYTYMSRNVNGIYKLGWDGSMSTKLSQVINLGYSLNASMHYSRDKNFYTLSGGTQQLNHWNNYIADIGQEVKYSDRRNWKISAGFGASFNGNYNKESSDENFHEWTFRGDGSFMYRMPWSMELNTNIHYLKRDNSYFSQANKPECIWNLEISQPVLKNKALQLRFEWFDILHDAKHTETFLGRSSYSYLWMYSYSSYVMIHATYQFNF